MPICTVLYSEGEGIELAGLRQITCGNGKQLRFYFLCGFVGRPTCDNGMVARRFIWRDHKGLRNDNLSRNVGATLKDYLSISACRLAHLPNFILGKGKMSCNG